jgi:hypothetical protein
MKTEIQMPENFYLNFLEKLHQELTDMNNPLIVICGILIWSKNLFNSGIPACTMLLPLYLHHIRNVFANEDLLGKIK